MSNENKQRAPEGGKHYVAMAGLRGYLPNYCDVFTTKRAAADSLAELHERGQNWRNRLQRDGFAALRPEDGNEYAEISECSCAEPWVHQDGLSKQQWLRECGEDFGLVGDK